MDQVSWLFATPTSSVFSPFPFPELVVVVVVVARFLVDGFFASAGGSCEASMHVGDDVRSAGQPKLLMRPSPCISGRTERSRARSTVTVIDHLDG